MNLLDKVITKSNLEKAYRKVYENKGSAGIDGMELDELLPYIRENWSDIRNAIKNNRYQPQPVKRVGIPKPDGGVRYLGIPTVTDRWIQQAILQVIESYFEPSFSNSSYGFRPNRGAHDALLQAKEYINEGYKFVIDMDIEKYFDTINQDKLMYKLKVVLKDKEMLQTINRIFKCGYIYEGRKHKSLVGCPQGSPLSPLCSNIYLDELDRELENRGHKFCRYADDCNIYLKSEKACERVLEGVEKFLDKKLNLKINREKTEIGEVCGKKFLGYTFYYNEKTESYELTIHPKTKAKFMRELKRLTKRNWSISNELRIRYLNDKLRGWLNYFILADMKIFVRRTMKWLRVRFRMIIWKQWKRVRTRFRNLMRFGINRQKAWEWANTRKGYWRVAHSFILTRTLTNNYFHKELGLINGDEYYEQRHV